MDPRTHYKSSQAHSWTRIDMLLHVYDHAIRAVKEGAGALSRKENIDNKLLRIDAQSKVMLIVDGLSPDQGSVPQNILRICEFVIDITCGNDAKAWTTAAEMLEVIRSGFDEIKEQARVAEAEGKIPALDFATSQ